MIRAVNSSEYPFLDIRVQIGDRFAPDYEFEVRALVDTGFDGGLAVPRRLIPGSITPMGQSVWNLAEGTEITAFSYFCHVTIGHLQPVATVAITLDGDALLGRHVIDKFRFVFDHGRQLIVEP